MRRNRPVLRSMAFLFPAGGFQSFYSSPTGKAAQLSGAFPRTLSAGKLGQHYASPRTPGNHPVSGKIQHFCSPRTPAGSGNRQCFSAPRTPAASGKVQHFSEAIPSPRTPYGSAMVSPSSARRWRKSSVTLFMPPATAAADKKKAAEQADEPISPHVTCIGRVRRQSHCKKPHHKDIINAHAHCYDSVAPKKKGNIQSKKPHISGSCPATCHSVSGNGAAGAAKTSLEFSTVEACEQKFGKNQLHNLHKIHGFSHDECGNANNILDQVALDNCNEGDDVLSMANGHIKDLMHLDSQNHGKQCSLGNVKCNDGDANGNLQQIDHSSSEIARMHMMEDEKVEFTRDCGRAEPSADMPVLRRTCSQTLNDMLQEAHDESQCLNESLCESQCQNPGLHELNHLKTQQSTDHCLLLIRSTGSRKFSSHHFDRFSSPTS